jgi:multiple sugar transport system permease protein
VLNLPARQTATVPAAIAKSAQESEIRYGETAAGAMPAFVFLLIGRRHIVRGLTSGAAKWASASD